MKEMVLNPNEEGACAAPCYFVDMFLLFFICYLAKLPAFAKLYQIFPFSLITTVFSDKEIHLLAKIHNILFLFTFPLYMIAETPCFCAESGIE